MSQALWRTSKLDGLTDVIVMGTLATVHTKALTCKCYPRQKKSPRGGFNAEGRQHNQAESIVSHPGERFMQKITGQGRRPGNPPHHIESSQPTHHSTAQGEVGLDGRDEPPNPHSTTPHHLLHAMVGGMGSGVHRELP